MSNGSKEFELFCSALRQRSEEPQACVQRFAHGHLDWSKILEGAKRHRVERQVLKGLSNLGLAPEAFVTELRKASQEAAYTSLMQIRETARLAASFRQANIPVMALKGVALSVQTGREPTDRHSRDIDFLIPENCLALADKTIRGAGYTIEGPEIHERVASYLRWNKEVKYSHPENHTLVELHYRLVDNEALLNYEFDELWRDREIIKVGGVDVAVMGRRHLPTYLCVHGAAHAWERLCWLIDLAAALPSPTAVTEAIEFACARGIAVPMLHAILLAHRWLGLSVTESELARAKNCRKVARLEALLARSYGAKTWYRSPARGSIEGFLRYSLLLRCFAFSLTPGWQYRKKQIARELIAPADWDTFRLRRSLSWAYPLLRPIGWIVRRLRGTV
jgi:hypothetical protein